MGHIFTSWEYDSSSWFPEVLHLSVYSSAWIVMDRLPERAGERRRRGEKLKLSVRDYFGFQDLTCTAVISLEGLRPRLAPTSNLPPSDCRLGCIMYPVIYLLNVGPTGPRTLGPSSLSPKWMHVFGQWEEARVRGTHADTGSTQNPGGSGNRIEPWASCCEATALTITPPWHPALMSCQ